jgi:mono/diheme cytochrome c family protein
MLWSVGCADVEARIAALPADPAAGEAVWAEACASCHGAAGEGTATGPDLGDEAADAERIAGKVWWGWGEMEGFRGELTRQEVADVVAWLICGVIEGGSC